MRAIILHGKKAAGRVTVIDDEDYDLVSAYTWRIQEKRRRCRDDGPYAVTSVRKDGRQITLGMHQIITGWPMTDHIDNDGLNNQRSNLRPATQQQNNQNSRPHVGSSSRYKGVTWHKSVRKWQAAIGVDGKTRYLGCFAVEEDAARAYNRAALDAFGAFAWLNEIPADAEVPA